MAETLEHTLMKTRASPRDGHPKTHNTTGVKDPQLTRRPSFQTLILVFGCASRDQLVFGEQGLSLVSMQEQLSQSIGKVQDGIRFFGRGIRLLTSDLGSAGRLFSRAALGTSNSSSVLSAQIDFGHLSKVYPERECSQPSCSHDPEILNQNMACF